MGTDDTHEHTHGWLDQAHAQRAEPPITVVVGASGMTAGLSAARFF